MVSAMILLKYVWEVYILSQLRLFVGRSKSLSVPIWNSIVMYVIHTFKKQEGEVIFSYQP